jgi:hypothetical protein
MKSFVIAFFLIALTAPSTQFAANASERGTFKVADAFSAAACQMDWRKNMGPCVYDCNKNNFPMGSKANVQCQQGCENSFGNACLRRCSQ